jgi:hypothetical protein
VRKLIATIALLSALVLTASAFAGVTKFTLSDVTYPDGTTGEIEAGVKDTNKSDLTNCAYFSDDYRGRAWLLLRPGRLRHGGGRQGILPRPL